MNNKWYLILCLSICTAPVYSMQNDYSWPAQLASVWGTLLAGLSNPLVLPPTTQEMYQTTPQQKHHRIKKTQQPYVRMRTRCIHQPK